MAKTTTRVNLSLNAYVYREFAKLRAEYMRVLGEKVELSSYTNDMLRQMVPMMRDFLEKHKKGQLTSDYMISHYHQMANKEAQKVIKEAKRKIKKKKA